MIIPPLVPQMLPHRKVIEREGDRDEEIVREEEGKG